MSDPTGMTFDEMSNPVWETLPIPFSCDGCDNEALYAAHGKQFCATCWQNRNREVAQSLPG